MLNSKSSLCHEGIWGSRSTASRNNVGPRERYEWCASRPGHFNLRLSVTGAGLKPEPVSTLWTRCSWFLSSPSPTTVTTNYPWCAGGITLRTCSSSVRDNTSKASATQLRRLVAGSLAAKFRVRSRAVHVGFAVEKVALRVFIQSLQFFVADLSYHRFTLFYPLQTLYSLSNRQRC